MKYKMKVTRTGSRDFAPRLWIEKEITADVLVGRLFRISNLWQNGYEPHAKVEVVYAGDDLCPTPEENEYIITYYHPNGDVYEHYYTPILKGEER